MELPITYGMLASYIHESETFKEAVAKITTHRSAYAYHRSPIPTRELMVRSVMRAITPLQAFGYVNRFRLKPLKENSLPLNFDERWLFVALMLRAKEVGPDDEMLCIVNFDGLIISDSLKDEVLLKSYGNWDSAVTAIDYICEKGILGAFDIDTQDYLLLCQKKRRNGEKKANGCCRFCGLI
ncbi:MAG: hypothetical protein LBB25_04175 [Holosporaceae bacterium]|jgi:hypothetical protein|nr:hypothetical protein [Holosporaceae bacterium]